MIQCYMSLYACLVPVGTDPSFIPTDCPRKRKYEKRYTNYANAREKMSRIMFAKG